MDLGVLCGLSLLVRPAGRIRSGVKVTVTVPLDGLSTELLDGLSTELLDGLDHEPSAGTTYFANMPTILQSVQIHPQAG